MVSSLDGQVLVVTGAAGGIGSATARRCSDLGAIVVLLDVDEGGLTRTARSLTGPCDTHVLDVRDADACRRVIDTVVAERGRVDIVWANAGVSEYGPLDLLPDGAWKRMIDINLVGAHNIVRAALPAVLVSRGHIAFTCSWASFAHQPGHSGYAAAKAGLEAFANALRLELSGTGVRVGSLHPGWIDTSMVTGKMAQPAFAALLAALPGPFGAVSPVDDIVPHIVRALERRSSRMVYPRAGRVLLVLRAALPTAPFTARSRAAAPRIRALAARDVRRS
ncbi:SDR family NAD(P)-dependent oxidoreductase [Rhodococcus sp. BP-149]|jgi:NAD(P)-dependent dehydrogenase (short-subunit alcohol dehydrogenase family)|uniref:SDR family NAD(P)-dependent oxidoreductase n=1 Tax=unclassified Rhodococcus (in: high G+C Gram-positive bacteria) TaxID=192944 RepID=UPI001C9B75DD|nr:MULTISPECIES: SDR family NAD(P)-dependent oxidoreductase [unclassified Rhodococcus (in: high G+C Gram-positive bacteria)]MBY6714823.1 SDR family NAD(P)-dependent oxidoreductase [Rhodococcus sp. BP-110]MBY6682845.1 SDR family NAD(P)-dependent oxidoreductase [Rhodococcus sp. BP-316]MBY6685473.1 SDR family NAD(P)-dependent oxidoreductase [Rhodococcus sp. BP-288]MBY6696825.1 SDR family NAD(P)-dependent oxidoreductase [Rhodococcus sp. BP-285]MBY6703481.1 SDR family NAD(P)-dependent oxidoreductas